MKRLGGWVVLIGIVLLSNVAVHAQEAWTASPMVKILRNTTKPATPDYSSFTNAEISAAKNEFEPFQIAIRTGGSSVTINDITINNLAGPSGNQIGGSNLVIYREAYLTIDPAQSNGFCCSSTIEGLAHPNGGDVPDALIPKIDEYFGETRNAFPYTIPANTTQAFWIDVYVPQNQPAGNYTGTVTITGSVSFPSINVSLLVRNFTLPSTPSLKTAYPTDLGLLRLGHDGRVVNDQRTKSLIKLYTMSLLRHRLSNSDLTFPAPPMTSGVVDWTDFDANWGPFLDGSGSVNVYNRAGTSIVKTFDLATGVTYDSNAGKLPGAELTTVRLRDTNNPADSTYYQNWASHFTTKGWFNSPSGGTRLFHYSHDEPKICESSPWTDIQNDSTALHATVPQNKSMVTTSVKRARGDYSCLHLDVSSMIDIYTPPVYFMDDKQNKDSGLSPYFGNQRSTYDCINGSGLCPQRPELWWYHACSAHGCNFVGGGGLPDGDYPRYYNTGWPTVMADLPHIYSRIFEWQTFLYRIQGELYYETVYAFNGTDSYSDGSPKCRERKQYTFNGSTHRWTDPWESIYCFGGHGDGTLFYPGIPGPSNSPDPGYIKVPVNPNDPNSPNRISVRIGGTNDIPIESIRLKLTREGVEDYEYLKMVKDKGFLAFADQQANSLGTTTMVEDGKTDAPHNKGLCNTGGLKSFCFTKDWKKIYAARKALADKLDAGGEFSLSTQVVEVILSPGNSSGPVTISVASINNFSSAVALTCSRPHVTVTCNFSPTSVTPPANGSSSSNLTIATTANTPPGPYNITVNGTSGGVSRQVTFRLTVQSQQRNFILSSSPSAVTIPAGNNTTSTITVSSIQGYNETVNLSCNAPSGTTCNLSTSSVTPPSNGNVTVTLSVQTTTSTPAGTYSITVSGVDIDNRLRQTTFTVTVAPPSFTMSVLPASATVTPGNGITATVTVTSVNSFSSEVSLSCPPINGVTCAFTPQKVTPPSNGSAVSTVSIQTSTTASAGTYTIPITGTSGTLSNRANFNLTVQGAADFHLPPPSLPSATVTPGGTAQSTVAVLSKNNFSSAVTLSCSTPDIKVTCSLNPTSVTPPSNGSGTSTLNVNTDISIAPGSYPVTVTGTSGNLTHQTTFGLTVSPPIQEGFSDQFNRANSTNLGSNWNEYLGDLEIFDNQVQDFAGNSLPTAAVFNGAIGPDQSVSVNCKVADTGNACGVMARWSDDNNFYRARLDAGQGNIVLFKTVAGVTTELGRITCDPASPKCSQTLTYDQYYHLRLVVRGASLEVYFNGEVSPVISVTDTSLATGSYAGIRSFASSPNAVSFDNFSMTVPKGSVLFSDNFNRTTGLGSNWKVDDGAFNTDGSQAVSAASQSWAAVTRNLGTDDYAVEAIVTVPAGSVYSGIVARGDRTYLWSDNYVAQIAETNDTVNLYRRNAGAWTLLKSVAAPGGVTAGQGYKIKLVVSGSNPVNLEVHFQGSLLFSYTDSAANRLISGLPGMQNYNSNVKYDNFTVYSLSSPSGTVFFDDQFNRTTGMGSDWQVYYGTFNTDGTHAVSAGTVGAGKWAGMTQSIPTNDYQVESILSVPAGTLNSGIIARGNSTDISTEGYVAQIATSGTVKLYRRSPGGVWTLLTSYTVPGGISAETFYNLKLVVSGSSPVHLEVFFQGSQVIVYDDNASNRILSGIPGIQNYDPNVKYDRFTVSSPMAITGNELFADDFNQTSGLGANWRVDDGVFNTDGIYAVSADTQSWAAVVPNLGTSDYAVESVLIVPAGSLYSGIVARGNPSTIYSDNYSLQIAETNDTVNLYRRNAGVWTLLKSQAAPGGVVAGQPYTLKLKVTGSATVNLEVYFQGSLLFTHADTAANRILTGVPGIQNYNTNVKYDSFKVMSP